MLVFVKPSSYWFHASIPHWFHVYGDCYPKVKHFWRIETDVLFAGRMDEFIQLTQFTKADVILPHLAGEGKDEQNHLNFYHWDLNRDMVNSIPDKLHRMHSLVSVGR